MKRILQYFITALLYGLVAIPVQAQFGSSDMGPNAVSSLAWDHISSTGASWSAPTSIGLTTDKRMYVWGNNGSYSIHTIKRPDGNGQVQQLAPYYLPSPAGETVKKVKVIANQAGPMFFCLTESGKFYAWGVRGQTSWGGGLSLLSTAEYGTTPAWPFLTSYTNTDTTYAIRKPRLLTVATETNIVDFDAATAGQYNYAMAIGNSGKAYYIDGNTITTFTAIPFPSGVDASFKYTKVWVQEVLGSSSLRFAYLKGNNGKIYYTGKTGGVRNTGVPSLYNTQLNTGDQNTGYIPNVVPFEVPFPAGEDIISMRIDGGTGYSSSIAISASGKGYITGGWRGFFKAPNNTTKAYQCYSAALKSAPVLGTELDKISVNVTYDSIYVLKKFVEVALPPGATKILDMMSSWSSSSTYVSNTLIVGDNNKVYWSGSNRRDYNWLFMQGGNFLSFANPPTDSNNDCTEVGAMYANLPYQWAYEAINFQGTAQFGVIDDENDYTRGNLILLSKSRRGYFVGRLSSNTGTGKLSENYAGLQLFISPFPVPIANEQLLSCQTSAGTGGPLGDPVSTPAAGVIDCSKTKLYPAPVQGTPSELSLLVTINVTTIGDFSPITISGSGMSLVSGFDKVSATTTGVQTFHIPIKYDGSTLTNAFQFTIGQAGSCSADLTKESKKAIVDVWTLECVPSVGPALKK